MNPLRAVALCLLLTLLAGGPGVPALAGEMARGAIYAPLYQEAVIDHRGHHLTLTATVYVRNTDPQGSLEISSITLYDGQGKAVTKCLEHPRRLAPLASLSFLAPRAPRAGGAPSLVVRWRAKQPVNPPLVEVVMTGAAGQQGISLTTTGTSLPLRP
jgi:hypothetical protein